MTCNEIRAGIAAGKGERELSAAARSHLASCELCRRWHEDHRIERLLEAWPVPEPGPAFAERALARAAEAHAERRAPQRRATMAGLAASLMVAVAAAVMIAAPSEEPAPSTVAAPSTRTVNVVIDARQHRSGALVTVELTEDLELEGYGDNRVIQWQTSLSKGRNLLSLPVRLRAGTKGDLRVALSYDDGAHQEMLIPVRSG